ncbi:MAG: group III truncated hemoglobin [Thermaceae bacterium]|nr:group III truncated hemoglobin [Thermaceae bacterium]
MVLGVNDLCTRADIATVINAFYRKATADPTIGYLFEGLDLEAHLPVMHDFWENILFRTGAYKGGMMYKHLVLNAQKPLQVEHFGRWLELFMATVDEHFSGENAATMKQFAHSVAATMQARILGNPMFPLAGK